jgi:diacylglycerol kinase family enzyme
MPHSPVLNPASPLIFIINAASGRSGADAKRAVIEQALQDAGCQGELRFARPADLPRVAREAAAQALATRSAVVAVGGDGTINAVAQAAHAAGCAMGVVPLGTFNYFARTHGIPTEPALAAQQLLQAQPVPVQVGTVNGHVFLVNASLGLYPVLLEDRETFKSRFGRSRWIALGAACMTLLRGHRQLRLRIDQGGEVREVRTPTLFVGNNRLQLEQVGLQLGEGAGAQSPRALDAGSIAAVMLKPISTWAMAGLMLRGALGTLGDADTVESFAFSHMVVKPRLRKIKVAFDGEVTRMRTPLEFRVAPQPLYLLKPTAPDGAADPV